MDGIDPFAPRTSLSSASFTSTDSFYYEDSSMYTSTTSSTMTQTSTSREICSANPNIGIRLNSNIYTYSEICAATNNFLLRPLSSSPSKAWRCVIRKKAVVVIQRKLRCSSVDMFETVNRLSRESNHINIIKLLGASILGDCIFLVYDYVSGINLADCLRNPNNPKLTVLKTWISRMRIATQIADGLEHIHQYVEPEMSIVHNHLKSTSVIVTGPYFSEAKICHFGTAELCGEIYRDVFEESGIEGRSFYMAPELIAGGMVSQKSDVFALGILLLMIISEEEPVKEIYDEESWVYKKISLIDSARDAIQSADVTKIRQWIDNRLLFSYEDKLAKEMMRVGLECVHLEPNKRPDVRCVAAKIRKLYLEALCREKGACQDALLGVNSTSFTWRQQHRESILRDFIWSEQHRKHPNSILS